MPVSPRSSVSPRSFFKMSPDDTLAVYKDNLIAVIGLHMPFDDKVVLLNDLLKKTADAISEAEQTFKAAGLFLMADIYFEIAKLAKEQSKTSEAYSNAYIQLTDCLRLIGFIYATCEEKINEEWIGQFNTKKLSDPKKAQQFADELFLDDLLLQTQDTPTHRPRSR